VRKLQSLRKCDTIGSYNSNFLYNLNFHAFSTLSFVYGTALFVDVSPRKAKACRSQDCFRNKLRQFKLALATDMQASVFESNLHVQPSDTTGSYDNNQHSFTMSLIHILLSYLLSKVKKKL
jgi:hypothetical protein